MGGERGTTTRRRLAGEICCARKVGLTLDPNHRGGERYCDLCAPRRKVYMHFMLNQGWLCQFLEPDLRTPAARSGLNAAFRYYSLLFSVIIGVAGSMRL